MLAFKPHKAGPYWGHMRRRDFVTLLGGAAATWSLAAHAQQPQPIRRIGLLMGLPENDLQTKAALAAFLQALQQSGWTDGRNVRIDYRWTEGNADNIRKYAAEFAALAPDVILTSGTATMTPLLQATRRVPVVFVQVPDPVGAGYVDSLARPGGNATGFTNFEYGVSGKWLELLEKDGAGASDPSGSSSRSCHRCRNRPVRRDSGRGAVRRCRRKPRQRA